MSIPEANDVLRFEAYNENSESAHLEISWSQTLRTKTASYYLVKADNTSKSNAAVILYIQDRFYKDEASPDHIKNIPGAKKEGNNWVIPITDRFQYGQKNASGEKRFLVLHDKNNKPYQHRFLVTTIQGTAAEWAKTLANSFGAGELADTVHKLGSSFVGDYLRTF
ncbi:hypothetical protein CEP52_013151 [Fusarium oligoseptatum]|uniref:Uncharacterized protein n=2 Tax=Fusarium solani species complex TaxID=232080 RepID=A0A428SUV3_9HYPO|nr:hypothetical protein CEP53_000306 [Fusarium sp. AF-6]RSL79753.1 hypothetical protein CEP51_007107 [Fusarium floridanum]RSL93589.1 hypothetical protein CEP52_013151 [Fusarium oligoseptatum]